MGRHRHFQTKIPNRQFELFEMEPPTGFPPTPDWSELPTATRQKLTSLMARLFADHAGGQTDDPRENAYEL
ncbi:hypothetical protein [Mesorhizobium sp. A556]